MTLAKCFCGDAVRSLDECKIWVIHSQGGYPGLCYAVGDPQNPKHLYGRQQYLLRTVEVSWSRTGTTGFVMYLVGVTRIPTPGRSCGG